MDPVGSGDHTLRNTMEAMAFLFTFSQLLSENFLTYTPHWALTQGSLLALSKKSEKHRKPPETVKPPSLIPGPEVTQASVF